MSTSYTWGARSWLKATPEAEWGVFDPSASPIWLRLEGDRPLTLQPRAFVREIAAADARGETIDHVLARIEVTGTLTTPLYPDQAGALLSWGLSPLAVGEPATYRLPSMTLDVFDGHRARRFLGTRVQTFSLKTSAADPVVLTRLTLQAGRVDPVDLVVSEPSASVWPAGPPYGLHDLQGGLLLGSPLSRKGFNLVELVVENRIDPVFDEEIHAGDLLYCGRTVSLTLRQRDRGNEPAFDQTAHETQTRVAPAKLIFQRGGRSVEINLRSRCRITEIRVETPLHGSKTRVLQIRSDFDPVAGDSLGWIVI